MRRAGWVGRIVAVAVALVVPAVLFAQALAKPTPTVDQIVDRYVEAIGGRAALEKQTSRVSMGTIEFPGMQLGGTVLIHEKAPNKILQVVILSASVFRQGFDGTTGWSDDPATGSHLLSGAELGEVRSDADFFHALHLRQIYPVLRFTGSQTVAGRAAYILQGTAPGAADPDTMYFDAETGLAVRLVSHHHTPDGYAEITESFEDFRAVDGIQLPFKISQTGGSADFTIHIQEVHHGTDLDDAEFSPPKSGAGKPQ